MCITSYSYAQTFKQGVPVETTTRTEVIIVEENDNYSVSFCPTYHATSPLTSGIIIRDYLSSKFNRKFKLIKHELPTISGKEYDYECIKESSIVRYRKIDQFFVVVSKFTKKQIEHYYIDVIDLVTMEKIVDKKEVIRFATKENNICFYIRKKGKFYELLLKRISGNKVGEYFQYFTLNSNFKVINYQKIPLDPLLFHGKLSVRQVNNNSTKLIVTNTIKNTENDEVRCIYGVFDIENDSYKFSKFFGPKNHSIADTKVLGEDNSDLLLSVLKTSNSSFIDRLGLIDLKSSKISILNIPNHVKEAISKVKVLYLSNYNQIKLKKLGDYIFSVETYQDFYSLNSGSERIYGPVFLFRIAPGSNKIVWVKIFSKGGTFEKDIKSEPLWVNNENSIVMLANVGQRGLTVFTIDKEDGNLMDENELKLDQSQKTYVDTKRATTFNNARFFYFVGKKGLRSGADYYSSKKSITPVLIQF